MKLDIICPIYTVDHDLFIANFKSWIKEIPYNRVLLGVNNKKELNFVKEVTKNYEQVEIIEQFQYKTLGACLAELMRIVGTEWFAYVHADVRITPWAFCVLERYMKDDVGIVESHREQWKGEYVNFLPRHVTSNYYYKDRAYSGFQIIKKEAIIDLIKRIEDDFIYRNEDIIFQAECIDKGFKYAKSWAMHIHQSISSEWTYSRKISHYMQYRGIVKYTKPTKITKKSCFAVLKELKSRYKHRIDQTLSFCFKNNANWGECITEVWDDL